MRNLTKTLAVVSMLIPASAYSLGIGDIKLHSALNQNLNAEIALNVSADEYASGIKVKLAAPEKFDEVGVLWTHFLSKIKFESVKRADGSVVVKLTSREALREPFLDFLLEVSWDKGSLYREFTVLVDPPTVYTKPTILVGGVANSSGYSPSSEVITTAQNTVAVGRSGYESVGRDDSLWRVAERVNSHDDVSIEQMMMAIYETNPHAFYKDNVNALAAGTKIFIPERDAILKLSKKQALLAFDQQNKIWKGQVRSTQQNKIIAAKNNSQLELEAPVEAEVNDSVHVVSSNDGVVGGGISSGTADNPTVLARMEKLEQQLQMMQKMLVLKDEQISILQNQQDVDAEIVSERAEEPVTEVAEPVIDNTQVDDIASTEITSAEIVNAGKGDTLENEAVVPTSSEVEKPPIEAEENIKPNVEVIAEPKPVVKQVPIVQPEPESDFIADNFVFIAGGLAFGILGLGGWFWRKRKLDELTESESMFAAASEIVLPDSDLESYASIDDLTASPNDETLYDVGTVGESSFLSEFTPSYFDGFDADQNEVDPISEADVYLAYGRYQQAEDLMLQAILDQPERNECKLKLLEIFYTNENKDAFEKFANELVAAGKHNDLDFWAKVVEMGVELDPNSPLFSDGIPSASDSASDDTEKERVSSPVVSAKDDNASEGVNDVVPMSGSSDIEDSFDLSVFDVTEDAVESSVADSKDSDEGLDFDLGVFDLDGTVNEQKEEELDDVESIDLEDAVSDKTGVIVGEESSNDVSEHTAYGFY